MGRARPDPASGPGLTVTRALTSKKRAGATPRESLRACPHVALTSDTPYGGRTARRVCESRGVTVCGVTEVPVGPTSFPRVSEDHPRRHAHSTIESI